MAKQKKQPDRREISQILLDRFSLTWRLMVDRRVEILHKLIPPLALLYIISPIDLIPDVFLPIGFVDDIGVAILALEIFIRMAPPDVVREHVKALKARYYDEPEPEDEEGFKTGSVIDGKYKVED